LVSLILGDSDLHGEGLSRACERRMNGHARADRGLRHASDLMLFVLSAVGGAALFVGIRNRSSLPKPRPWIVEVDLLDRFAPVEVTRVAIGSQDIVPGIYRDPERGGKPFKADVNWLEELVLWLRNRTAKTIGAADLQVCFPETTATGLMMCSPVEVGCIPPPVESFTHGGASMQVSSCPFRLEPGAVVRISVRDYAQSMREFVEERQPFSTITSCFIHFQAFHFDGGMKCTPGHYWVPKASRPGLETSLAPTFFPGSQDLQKADPVQAGAERRPSP
jgi:hypothetical protein